MLIRACLNGGTTREQHPAVPVTPDELAADAVAVTRAVLDSHGQPGPRLHHGYRLATWDVIRAALQLGRDIRVGLEDTGVLPDGSPAAGNADLVAAAVRLATAAGRQVSPSGA